MHIARRKNFITRAAVALTLALSTALGAGCVDRPPGASADAPASASDLSGFPTGKLRIERAAPGGENARENARESAQEFAQEFEIWIADTAERRTRGLMFVEHLPKDRGMLFLFGDPQRVSMWMKNTLIPLDMLFVARDGRIARIAANTEPQSLDTIESGADVTAVLELAGGECARRGIQVGDYLRHAAFTAPP